MEQYSSDFDERLPIYHGEVTNQPMWTEQIESYLKTRQLFRCPSYRKTTETYGDLGYPSYGMIGRDDATSPGGGNERHIYDADGALLAWVPRPSITFLLIESTANINNYPLNGQGYFMAIFSSTNFGSPINGTAKTANSVHFDGYNVAFVDGHAKWLKRGSEISYATSLHTYCLAAPDC